MEAKLSGFANRYHCVQLAASYEEVRFVGNFAKRTEDVALDRFEEEYDSCYDDKKLKIECNL